MKILKIISLCIYMNYHVIQSHPHCSADEVCNITESNEKEVDQLKQHLSRLTEDLVRTQFREEQRVRSEGWSGIQQIRQRRSGGRNYYVESHTGYEAGGIHDTPNSDRAVGIGELEAVLNGVHFRTRHNDYPLRMPHKTSYHFRETQPIDFPDVPEAVLEKTTVEEQIEEMREWFRAWKQEDSTIRPFCHYFKPIMCYLEGGWFNTEEISKNVHEPFNSFKHFTDAKTWDDLHDKARFTAYTGSKSLYENLSFLPSTIIDIDKNGFPVYAQWNYRILCNPLKKYLSVRKFQIVEDLNSRMMTEHDIYRHIWSRAARFQLKGINRPRAHPSLLDELMGEIPGMDNYPGNATGGYGFDHVELDSNKQPKDLSRYHRWFKSNNSNLYNSIHRGFADDTLFSAKTFQHEVAGIDIQHCKNNIEMTQCRKINEKWTFAIPLEIIYLTPLTKWNPYGFKHWGEHIKGTPTTLDGRNGDCNQKKAMNGTNSQRLYQTPFEFFSGKKHKLSLDDTTRTFACVLDPQGQLHKTHASGVHIILPYIDGVGVLRQRYPIFPVHGEGSAVWKELSALRDIFMAPEKHEDMLWTDANLKSRFTKSVEFALSTARDFDPPHKHYVVLSKSEIDELKSGKEILKETTESEGHMHELLIRWSQRRKFFFRFCDGQTKCPHAHPRRLARQRLD